MECHQGFCYFLFVVCDVNSHCLPYVRLLKLVFTPEVKNYQVPQVLQQIKSVHVVDVFEHQFLTCERLLFSQLAMKVDDIALGLPLHVLLLGLFHLHSLYLLLLLKFLHICVLNLILLG